MRKVIAIAERANDGFYSVYTAAEALPFGVTGEGETMAEAITDFKNVYAGMHDAYVAETGKDLDIKIETALQQFGHELSQVTFA